MGAGEFLTAGQRNPGLHVYPTVGEHDRYETIRITVFGEHRVRLAPRLHRAPNGLRWQQFRQGSDHPPRSATHPGWEKIPDRLRLPFCPFGWFRQLLAKVTYRRRHAELSAAPTAACLPKH